MRLALSVLCGLLCAAVLLRGDLRSDRPPDGLSWLLLALLVVAIITLVASEP